MRRCQEACAAAPVIGVLDLQRGADQLQGMRVLRSAVLQRHAGVVLAVDDGEGDLAARFFQAPAGPGALADIQFEAQAAGVEVRRGDPHRAVAAGFVGDGFDAAVAGIAHQHRGEQAAGAVPGLGAEQVALGELPGVRRAQLQSLQHLGAGLPDEAVPAFQHATDEGASLVRQRRAEVGRGEHQEALDRRAGGVEVAGQPVAQHQGAGTVHHHVHRARCPRQSLGGPGAIQGGGEVSVGDVVLQGDPVGEADLRRRAAEPGFQLLGEAAERLRIVAPAVDDDDRTGHVRHPLGLIRATIDHAPRRCALTCENV